MISRAYKCIFIHQRKVAGSSIITSFGITTQEPEWHLFNNGTLSDEWARRDKLAPGYTIFTAVRNPWDRFISGWKYLEKYRNRPLAEVLRDLPTEGHDYRHLVRPQLDILVDADGKFVADHVLRFETLAADYARLCERIGKKDATLPVLNTIAHGDYHEYYTPETAAAVGELFKKDIEFFGYRF